jgi:serine/threonine protein kinase
MTSWRNKSISGRIGCEEFEDGPMRRNQSFHSLNDLIKPGTSVGSHQANSRYLQDFDEIGLLGYGGFGKVFEVRNKLDGEHYAVKKIRFSGKNIAKKLRTVVHEVKALAKLVHPNIVRYYQAWTEEEAIDKLQFGGISPKKDDKSKIYSKLYSSESLTLDEENDSNSIIFQWSDSEDELVKEMHVIAEGTYRNHSHFSEPTPFREVDARQNRINKSWDNIKREIQESIKPEINVNLFIQMQLCVGILSNWLESRHEIDPTKNLVIFSQICQGLKYVHENGIVHRDLKPSNIFLAKSELNNPLVFDTVVIGDFGLATKLDEEYITQGGIGTHLYCSPESREKGIVTTSTDIFALGVILFELYYKFETHMERARLITDLHNGRLPISFHQKYPVQSRLILSMCSPNPQERPSCDQILRSSFLHGELITVTRKEFYDLKDENDRIHREILAKNALIEEQARQIAELQRKLLLARSH